MSREAKKYISKPICCPKVTAKDVKCGGMKAHQPIKPPNAAANTPAPAPPNQGRKKHRGIKSRKIRKMQNVFTQ